MLLYAIFNFGIWCTLHYN